MTSNFIRAFRAAAGVQCVLLLAGGFVLFAAPPQSQKPSPDVNWAAADDQRPAEQVYKNIQLMNGKPAFRLKGMMQALNGLLGVECTYCHVSGQWESEDIEAKKTARKMFQMMGDLNKNNFPGKKGLSCWTCHRGHPKPELIPPGF